ncbi:MAG TPA: hypothetical protein VMM56_09895 [Planctomycetaceae bacterium]|nr:hypothetical protein [Planctomycetaceae bacterium]
MEKKWLQLLAWEENDYPNEDRRDKPLRIRLTDEEREKLDKAAEKAGHTNTSAYARSLLLEDAEKRLSSNESVIKRS